MRPLINGVNLSARIAPTVAGLVAFAIVAGLLLSGAHAAYNHLLTFWGFEPFRYPFVDLEAPFAAWECSRKGVDVIISDPCDVLGRGYTYSPFWMTIDWIPLTKPDSLWAGLVLGSAFLISLSGLPPALSVTENGIRVAAVLSTMTAFAIERENPDLLIFLLVIGALPLLRRSAIAKAFGYSLIFLAGAIKYYPFVLLGLVARERLRLGIAIAVASLAALAAFYSIYASQIHEGLPYIPRGIPFGDMFGAKNLPLGMLMVFRSIDVLPMSPISAVMITMALVLTLITWAITRLTRTCDISAALCRIDEARRLTLLAGALLLSGCFFAGQNVAYRGIFLLLVIPGLSALARDRKAGAIASASRLTVIAIPIFMWAEGIRVWIHLAIMGSYPPIGFRTILTLQQPWDLLIWFVREVGWWTLIGFLLTILISDLAGRPLKSGVRLLLRSRA